MKTSNIISGRSAVIALALLAGAGLSACGGDHDDNDTNNGGVIVSPAPPAPVVDAFFTAVSAIVSQSSDSNEAGAVDAIVNTLPENSEPESVG